MKKLAICLALFMTAGLLEADKKNDSRFSPGPASSFASKQTNDRVTVAVSAYDTEELAHKAFGKLDPNQYGVLPVLVIIQNDTDQVLKLDQMEVQYTGAEGNHVDATPPADVQTLGGGRKPAMPNGTPLPRIKHKSPLNAWEIDGRSFAARILPAHESANGFFYFQTEHRPGSRLYLTGIKEARTGKDILYFEIPLDFHR